MVANMEKSGVKTWYGAAGYLVACFAILVMIAFFARDGAVQVDPWSPIDQVFAGLSLDATDPVTFTQAATDIYRHGRLTAGNQWIFHLWPPGFISLEVAVLKLVGLRGPLIAVLQILACALLACMLSLQRIVLRPLVGRVAGGLLPLLITAFPIARIFLLSPFGVAFGETFSVTTFISACLLVYAAVDTRRLTLAVASGVGFALSAYFRSQYESVLVAATVAAMPLVGWFAVVALSVRTGQMKRAQANTIVRSVMVSLIIAHLLMVPWRLHNLSANGSVRWVQTLDIIMNNSLTPDRALIAKGGQFVIEGGGNLACRLEPTYCGESDNSLFFKAFVRHPVEWIEIKAALIKPYWFASSKDITIVRSDPSDFDNLCNLIFLCCAASVPVLLVFLRSERTWPVLVWINVAFYGAFFLILVLVQYEIRYFYLLKLYSLSMSTLLMSMAWRRASRGPVTTTEALRAA